MENKMSTVAKLLGVELEEKFMLKDFQHMYKLTEKGLMYWSDISQIWENSNAIGDLLTGKYEIVKLSKLILTEKEKEYLSAVTKPFRDRKVVIKKYGYPQNEYKNECIQISVEYYDKTGGEMFSLPIFKKGTMYKGLESNKCYTLEELDL